MTGRTSAAGWLVAAALASAGCDDGRGEAGPLGCALLEATACGAAAASACTELCAPPLVAGPTWIGDCAVALGNAESCEQPLGACGPVTCVAGAGAPALNERFFTGASVDEQPCSPWPDEPAPTRLIEVLLARTADVLDEAVEAWTQEMAEVYRPYGIHFFTSEPVVELPAGAVMSTSTQQAEDALVAAGLDPRGDWGPSEQATALDLLGDVVFSELRDFVLDAVPGADTDLVRVVVVDSIAAPTSLIWSLFEDIYGIGLSPSLLAMVENEQTGPGPTELFGLSGPFAPIAIVGDEHAAELGPLGRRHVLAHEVGHALGLPHVEAWGNVMSGVGLECVSTLDPDQLGAIASLSAPLELTVVERLVELPERYCVANARHSAAGVAVDGAPAALDVPTGTPRAPEAPSARTPAPSVHALFVTQSR